MKKLVLVVAVLACAFAAVAGEKSARSSGSDTRIWLPLGLSIISRRSSCRARPTRSSVA